MRLHEPQLQTPPGRARHAWKLHFAALLLSGCPAYGPEDCVSDRGVCGPDYSCDIRTGACVKIRREASGRECTSPAECSAGQTCAKSGECVAGSCAVVSCVDGYRCELGDGGHICIPKG